MLNFSGTATDGIESAQMEDRKMRLLDYPCEPEQKIIIGIIFLMIFALWLTQYLNESSIGNFYGNFFTKENSAKIAARNSKTATEVAAPLPHGDFLSPSNGLQPTPNHPEKNGVKTVVIKFTAYYGPKRSQKKFFNGNFKREVRMNGKGELTAYGTKPRLGIVATDPEVFPRGTRFLLVDPLDGQEKVFVAEDTGGGIKGHHLDFFVGWGKNGYERVKKIQSAGDTMIVKILHMPT
ncbi:MAG: 3D domain-containing protein [Candidatus Moranbacteria bacterium]|nr:3D domain-containing protein [Candidatus Moranbacteria bacterium]